VHLNVLDCALSVSDDRATLSIPDHLHAHGLRHAPRFVRRSRLVHLPFGVSLLYKVTRVGLILSIATPELKDGS
jgi:hypothetical protein